MSLSTLLSQLTALSKLHQFSHWKTQGQLSYQDHLLFERLYNETNAMIDGVAEKSVGLFGGDSIDMVVDSQQVSKLLAGWKELRTEQSLPEVALKAVKDVIAHLAELRHGFEEGGKLTDGLDNHLQGLSDSLESHVYLLQQRTAKAKTAAHEPSFYHRPDFIRWLTSSPERVKHLKDKYQSFYLGLVDSMDATYAFQPEKWNNDPSQFYDWYLSSGRVEEDMKEMIEADKQRIQEANCPECEGTGWTKEGWEARKDDADPWKGDCEACGGTGLKKELPEEEREYYKKRRELKGSKYLSTTKTAGDLDLPDDALLEELEKLRREQKKDRPRLYIDAPELDPPEEEHKEDGKVDYEIKLASTEEYKLIEQKFTELQDTFRLFAHSKQQGKYTLADQLTDSLKDELFGLQRRLLSQLKRDRKEGMGVESWFMLQRRADLSRMESMLEELREYQKDRAQKKGLRDTPDAPLNLAPIVIRKKDRNLLLDPRELKEVASMEKSLEKLNTIQLKMTKLADKTNPSMFPRPSDFEIKDYLEGNPAGAMMSYYTNNNVDMDQLDDIFEYWIGIKFPGFKGKSWVDYYTKSPEERIEKSLEKLNSSKQKIKIAVPVEYEVIDQQIGRMLEMYNEFMLHVKSRNLKVADQMAELLVNFIPALQSELRKLINEDINQVPESFIEETGLKLQLLNEKSKAVKMYLDQRRLGLGKGTDKSTKPLVMLKKHKEPTTAQEENMNDVLSRLLKLAYHLDLQGLKSEADQIDEMVQTLIKRVGLSPEALVATADYLDSVGLTEAANKLDGLIAEAAKKTKYKTWKGKDEKPPTGAERKAPKGWWDKQEKELKKKNPDYSAKRISEVLGDLWDNQLTHAKRQRIFKQYGKKGDPDVAKKD